MMLFACAGLLAVQTSPITEGVLVMGEHRIIAMTIEISGRPFRFLFSTGAERTIVRPDVYQALTGKSVTGKNAEVSQESFELRLGGHSVGRGPLVGSYLELFNGPIDGFRPFHGILGRDFISQRAWTFNFVEMRYQMLPANTPPASLAGYTTFRPILPVAKGYYLPAAQREITGPIMVDTGATVLAIDRVKFPRTGTERVGMNGSITGPDGPLDQSGAITQNHYMLPSLTIGGQKIAYPIVYPFRFPHTGIVGIVGPYVLGCRAIAFFPSGAVGVAAEPDRDFRINRALQRITGLNLTTRSGKIFIDTELPEDIGREYEVVSVADLPAARLLALVSIPDDLAFARLAKLWKFSQTVQVRGRGWIRKLVLATSPRS